MTRVLVILLLLLQTRLSGSEPFAQATPNRGKRAARTWKSSPIAYAGLGVVFASGRERDGDLDLTVGGHYMGSPSWSPDRSRLAASTGASLVPDYDPFEIPSAGGINSREDGIYVLSANGQGKWRVTWGQDECPAWSPDGTRILFERHLTGVSKRRSALYGLELRTRKLTKLTTGEYDDRQPHWAPDCRTVAFCSNRTGEYKVWLLDVSTHKPTMLRGQPEGNCLRPQWSPDRSEMLLVGTGKYLYDCPAKAYRVNVRTGAAKQVRLPRLLPDRVVWSPDGKRIAFMSAVTGRSWSICTSWPDGSHVRRVLPRHEGGMKNGWNLAW